MDYHLRLKGFVGGWDFDTDYTQYILDKYAGQTVNVIIDSLGGVVYTALSISAAFKVHGDVHVHYVGANASAATIASLGAKHVSIDADGWYLVHKCSTFYLEYASLNADELEKKIEALSKDKDQLDRMDRLVAAAYARKCKKKPEDLLALMDKSAWLSAQEALEWGFVDEVTNFEEDSEPVIDAVTAAFCLDNNIELPEGIKRARSNRDAFSAFRRFANLFNFSNNNNSDMDEHNNVVPDQEQQTGQAPENNEQIDKLNAEIEQLKKQNEELQAKLDKIPADDHNTVIEDNKKAEQIKTNLSASARDLYNAIS